MAIAIPPGLSGLLNDGPPVTPRPSATVLLVRGEQPFELLLMRRPGGADFAPGAHVFPGGSVHAQDSEWGDEIAGAAVREVFEEVGILLARRSRRLARDIDNEEVRSGMAKGLTFVEALQGGGLTPTFSRLALLARWVTPHQLRRRFDTRFFLARLPAGQTIHAQDGEVEDWLWISPAAALRDPKIELVYATRTVLESVATGEDATTIISRARAQGEVPVTETRLTQTETGWKLSH